MRMNKYPAQDYIQQWIQRRPLQAVDVRTGVTIARIPSRREGGVVPFNWTDTQRVKPLYIRRPETGDADHFAGVSLKGRAYPFDIRLNEVHYLSTAKESARRSSSCGLPAGPCALRALSRWPSSCNNKSAANCRSIAPCGALGPEHAHRRRSGSKRSDILRRPDDSSVLTLLNMVPSGASRGLPRGPAAGC